jgi:hypothetical protein
MIEHAASRLFTRQTQRRVRKPVEAARLAFRNYDIITVSKAGEMIFRLRPASETIDHGHHSSRTQEHDDVVENDIEVELDNANIAEDDAGIELDDADIVGNDADVVLDDAAGNSTSQDATTAPGVHADSNELNNIRERHEGRDVDTDVFRALLTFASDELSLDEAKQRYYALRRSLSHPFEVRISLRQANSDDDEALLTRRPLCRISGASCTCGRDILCGFPCEHFWLALPHLLVRQQEPRLIKDDRLFSVDLVSYDEAEHLLHILCAKRWFHRKVSANDLLLGRTDCYSLPIVPAPRYPVHNDRTSAAESMKRNVADTLAAILTLLSTGTHSHAALTSVHKLITESFSILANGRAIGSVAENATPLDNPNVLPTRNKKRSPQRVQSFAPNRRASSRRGRKARKL